MLRRRRRRSGELAPYLFISPAFIFYLLFLIIPLVGVFVLSLTRWNGFRFSDIRWIGLGNYFDLVNDPVFIKSLGNSLYFVVGSVLIETTLGLVVALLLDQNVPYAKAIRGVFFMPSVMSLVVVGLVFKLILSPSFGLVKPLLSFLGLGHWARDWLGSPSTALTTMLMIQIWYIFGYSMFVFVAGLQSIDIELYNAAKIDGASDIQRVRYITLPLLRETWFTVLILSVIHAMKIFTLPFVMTRGGPNHATEVLGTWAYFKSFNTLETGYGATVSAISLVITFVFTYLLFKANSLARGKK